MDENLANRILSDLNKAFSRDPNIDEFGIVPVSEPIHNKSPVICVEHKLGLEYWCTKNLYLHFYTKLIQMKIKDGNPVICTPEEILQMLRLVLLLNSDVSTFWNMRKEFVCEGILNPLDDLKFSALILTVRPKSSETFAHRKWLLRFIWSILGCNGNSIHMASHITSKKVSVNDIFLFNEQISSATALTNRLLEDELKISARAADHYFNNYNAWSHRTWVIQHCSKHDIQILYRELVHTEEWMTSHVSEYSGLSYRQFLFQQILSQTKKDINGKVLQDIVNLIHHELKLNSELIETFPGHEALWYFRRFILHLMCSCKCQTDTSALTNLIMVEPDVKKSKLDAETSPRLNQELLFINKIMKENRQTKLADHYKRWLGFHFTFTNINGFS